MQKILFLNRNSPQNLTNQKSHSTSLWLMQASSVTLSHMVCDVSTLLIGHLSVVCFCTYRKTKFYNSFLYIIQMCVRHQIQSFSMQKNRQLICNQHVTLKRHKPYVAKSKNWPIEQLRIYTINVHTQYLHKSYLAYERQFRSLAQINLVYVVDACQKKTLSNLIGQIVHSFYAMLKGTCPEKPSRQSAKSAQNLFCD